MADSEYDDDKHSVSSLSTVSLSEDEGAAEETSETEYGYNTTTYPLIINEEIIINEKDIYNFIDIINEVNINNDNIKDICDNDIKINTNQLYSYLDVNIDNKLLNFNNSLELMNYFVENIDNLTMIDNN